VSFTINQTGLERGATQLVFPEAPIILSRDDLAQAPVSVARTLTGQNIAVELVVTEDDPDIRIRVHRMTAAHVATLRTLRAGGGPLTAKLTPGSATTIDVVFRPASEQMITPYTGPHTDATDAGAALDAILTTSVVELSLGKV
jgi:hypothetical protein